ncbi:survival protein sure-like phosphatase/nucleotidase [Coniella lustricola]|uniref:Survival protein sure-like phosphatase/nucleotidase n=1 Tax=Coniella lustricola TaxID=2025994 RepID=A0A2T3AGU3_9PEZI|nr:survival protein sure-like phosphatase/nucleotidase [Coniella lustricola]
MHILVTNDDGPPSPHSSPYVHSLVRELQAAGHTVSVCLPHTQRSWIGKAHMIGQTLKPTYYRPPPLPTSSSLPAGLGAADDAHAHGSTHFRPSSSSAVEEWVLVDGTPASCVQIGLYHYFTASRGPIDLVVSGPNYGRNTTAVFALSSGTLGGALEAAACGKRAIALSYAFFSRNHDPDIVAGASRHSVKVIEALARQWPADKSVDVYSVNVPLVENVEQAKTVFAPLLQNYWTPGLSAFEAIEADVGEDGDEEEERIRRAEEINSGAKDDGAAAELKKTEESGGHEHRHFKWAPQLGDVMKATNEAPEHVDGQVVRTGKTSVTPLKANFWHASTHLHEQELKNSQEDSTAQSTPTTLLVRPKAEAQEAVPSSTPALDNKSSEIIYAVVDYEDKYVDPIIRSALEASIPAERLRLLDPSSATIDKILSSADDNRDEKLQKKYLQIRPYESLDFEHAMSNPATSLINSYVIRKALIRKHFLSTTVDHWVAKNPNSPLRNHVMRAEAFEVDYAEFLDDALVETFDLRASMERNEELDREDDNAGEGDEEEEEWWILKPSMSDRGQGIRLFSSMDELQNIFDQWEEDQPSSDDEDEDEADDHTGNDATENAEKDYITTSHLRHFVAQPYIHPPLLLSSCDNRKFHIRTYVLCAGAMRVYVCREMLALFAAKPYSAPWDQAFLDTHLTNTCLQGERADAQSVQRFWGLDMAAGLQQSIFASICEVSGEIFEAAARGMMIHFQPLPFAFEVYGLDFLVDSQGTPWLLEVNAFPDFKQTGDDLKETVVSELWRGVMRCAVGEWAGLAPRGEEKGNENMVLVRDVDLGRR